MQLKEEIFIELYNDIVKSLSEIPESITSGISVVTTAFNVLIKKSYTFDIGLVEFREILLKSLHKIVLDNILPYHINDQLFVLITTKMGNDLITTIYGLNVFKKVATKRDNKKGLLSCFKKKEVEEKKN